MTDKPDFTDELLITLTITRSIGKRHMNVGCHGRNVKDVADDLAWLKETLARDLHFETGWWGYWCDLGRRANP